MRYRPPGFGPGKPGTIGSESESTDEEDQAVARPKFQFPKSLGMHSASAQHDAQATTAADRESGVKKARKKKQKDREGDAVSQPVVNGGSASPSARKAKPVQAVVEVPPVALPNSTALENGSNITDSVSKEDKAKRKEEKRLKREQKEARRKARDAATGE